MQCIDTRLIQEAVYKLCLDANVIYSSDLYNNLLHSYESAEFETEKTKLANIVNNIKLSYDTKRPLCQDTGQVIVFLEIGQNLNLTGKSISDAVNMGIAASYKDNYFRKSIVNNALFDRSNTGENSPGVIYTDIVPGDVINIKVLIKGAGSENYSTVKMMNPAASESDIFEFIKNTVLTAGEKSCPPVVIGIGIGGTMDSAALMSKKAFFKNIYNDEELVFINALSDYLGAIKNNVLDIKLMTSSTHIACMPVAITINCHCTRHAECKIVNSEIIYKNKIPAYKNVVTLSQSLIRVNTDDINTIRGLQSGDRILLSGEIYTARDAAHKLMLEYYNKYDGFPFDINNKIIFYAGPCPAAPGEIIGPVGPTTSARMDKYCDLLYKQGLIATIGKGERSPEALDSILKYNGRYFAAQGGISCILAKCVKKSEVIAFEKIGTEAVRKLYVEDLPLTVEV